MNKDMETKKQEVIRKAYGEYWDRLSELQKEFALRHNGAVYIGYSDNDKKLFKDIYKSGLFDNQPTRPKSLAGIENNNGWIAIENEEDLPKKLGKYKVVLKDRVPFTWIFETFCDIESSGELWMSRYSHYKKVEEELPPIY